MDRDPIPKTETSVGMVSGLWEDGICRFAGIPYAKPPVGPLRWRMPEPHEAWAGVRDCSAFGSIAPQVLGAGESLLGGVAGEKSEDCLTLNVWTPSCDGARRPVMVWIHGGAFVTGAGSANTYSGEHLARRGDVVVVTVNYRLGALGFLNMSDATDGKLPGTGTEGLADQICALQWIKDNIAVFGGDPSNVTLFGESAGAMSVCALMASPRASGLFHKAIAQSGAAHIGHGRDKSARIARLFLEKLATVGLDAAGTLDAPWQKILDGQTQLLAEPRATGSLPFAPTIDGCLLPETPIERIRSGATARIPLITGTTRDEWKLFTATAAKLRLMNDDKLRAYVGRQVGGENADYILSAYEDGSPFERWNAVMTDKGFAVPALKLAEAQSRFAPTWLYRFDWQSPFLRGVLGSCHALELGFVFGTYNQRLATAFFGAGPKARSLSVAMMDAWLGFARTATPTLSTGTVWPTYDGATRRVLVFGDFEPRIESRPNEARRLAWQNIPDAALGP